MLGIRSNAFRSTRTHIKRKSPLAHRLAQPPFTHPTPSYRLSLAASRPSPYTFCVHSGLTLTHSLLLLRPLTTAALFQLFRIHSSDHLQSSAWPTHQKRERERDAYNNLFDSKPVRCFIAKPIKVAKVVAKCKTIERAEHFVFSGLLRRLIHLRPIPILVLRTLLDLPLSSHISVLLTDHYISYYFRPSPSIPTAHLTTLPFPPPSPSSSPSLSLPVACCSSLLIRTVVSHLGPSLHRSKCVTTPPAHQADRTQFAFSITSITRSWFRISLANLFETVNWSAQSGATVFVRVHLRSHPAPEVADEKSATVDTIGLLPSEKKKTR
jgi:hypothetical protein